MSARYDIHGDPNFPALTSPEKYPLHLRDGAYPFFACDRPEEYVGVYDWRCPACVIAAKADLYNHGDVTCDWEPSFEEPFQEVLHSWLIARSEYWGVLEGPM